MLKMSKCYLDSEKSCAGVVVDRVMGCRCDELCVGSVVFAVFVCVGGDKGLTIPE
jgi:hypothetical protein